MQTSCPVDFHAIKGVSPVPPPSKVNHGTSWAGATVCEWQLVQLDPLGAKNAMNSPVAGLGPPRQDWLIHLGAGAVGDPYWRSRSAWCSIGSAAALVAPAAGPFPSVCLGTSAESAGSRALRRKAFEGVDREIVFSWLAPKSRRGSGPICSDLHGPFLSKNQLTSI